MRGSDFQVIEFKIVEFHAETEKCGSEDFTDLTFTAFGKHPRDPNKRGIKIRLYVTREISTLCTQTLDIKALMKIRMKEGSPHEKHFNDVLKCQIIAHIRPVIFNLTAHMEGGAYSLPLISIRR